MAADSTFNDTESLPRDTAEDPESSLGGHAPRPPRPSRRAAGMARIPMPAPAMRSGSGTEDASVEDGASAEGLDSEPASSAERAARAREKRVKAAAEAAVEAAWDEPRPEESFADLAEHSDRAPPAPLTPSRGMPAVAAPRRQLDSSPAVSVSLEEDREDTQVGEVPRDLLELSGGGADECTRAYTAPQELIELAKRKREERLRAKADSAKADKAAAEAHLRETQRPPARGAGAADEVIPLVPKAPRAVSDLGVRSPAPAAARPSGRPSSSEALRAFSESLRAPGFTEPGSDNQPASSELDSAPAFSAVKSRADVSPQSLAKLQATYKTPWFGGSRRWLLIVALFVIVGFALSRWSTLSHLFFR
jgi:hypothetical protein